MGLTAKKVYAILNKKIGKGQSTPLFTFKGSVETANQLPQTGVAGDVYTIQQESEYGAANSIVAWDGTKWVALGNTFDTSAFGKSLTLKSDGTLTLE